MTWIWVTIAYALWVLMGFVMMNFNPHAKTSRFQDFCMWSLIPLYFVAKAIEAGWRWLFVPR